MPRLRYSVESREDLKRILHYIAQDKPIAAREWVAKIREKCRLLAKHPNLGDLRSELGDTIRSSYVGNYVIFFRQNETFVDILRVFRGDRDTQSL